MIPYYYCMIKTKLKEVDKQVVLDVPCQLYSQYIMDGNKSVTYSGRIKGRSVLALVAVKTEDKGKIQKLAGYIGDKWSDVKGSDTYKTNYTVKMKDVKKTIDDKGVVTEYVGIDKDEPFKFAEWCEEKEIVK